MQNFPGMVFVPKGFYPRGVLSQRCFVPALGVLSQRCFVPEVFCPRSVLSQRCFVPEVFCPTPHIHLSV